MRRLSDDLPWAYPKPMTSVILATLLTTLLLSCAPKAPSLPNVEEIRMRASALYEVQGLLSWYSNTFGEKSVQAKTYIGHEDLFSLESIVAVVKARKSAKGDDEQRSLDFLKAHLIWEYVNLRTAHHDDKILDAEANGMVHVTGIPGDIAYRDLDGMIDNESDPGKREALQAAMAKYWAEVLNPIHAEKMAEEHAICEELGYDSYVAVSEELRSVDLKEFVQLSGAYLRSTDELYRELFAYEARDVLGKEISEFRRSDIGRLSQFSSFNKYFPAELVLPSFKMFLEGIGLDMSTTAGTQIHVDAEPRASKDPRAVCYSLDVPRDVRISVKPSNGVPDYETMFHEGGHAVHFASATTSVWEFQQLGNNTATEAYSGLYEALWGDPDWLKHYREYVRDYNRFVDDDDEVPLMSDAEIARLVKNRAFWELYFARRYAGAKLVYETVLHGGDPAIYESLYDGSAGNDMQETYRQLFSRAYGFEMTSEEALRFRTDVDAFFYAADYSRSYALAKQLHEGLSKKFGDPWWRSEEAGAFLKNEIFAHANKLHGDEVTQLLGYDKIDWKAFDRVVRQRLAFASSITDG